MRGSECRKPAAAAFLKSVVFCAFYFFFPLSTAEFFCLFVELLQWREPHAAAVLSRHSGFDKPAAERRVPAAAVSEQRRCHRRRSSWKAAARLGAGISALHPVTPPLCGGEGGALPARFMAPGRRLGRRRGTVLRKAAVFFFFNFQKKPVRVLPLHYAHQLPACLCQYVGGNEKKTVMKGSLSTTPAVMKEAALCMREREREREAVASSRRGQTSVKGRCTLLTELLRAVSPASFRRPERLFLSTDFTDVIARKF